jgi:hypothetical protein
MFIRGSAPLAQEQLPANSFGCDTFMLRPPPTLPRARGGCGVRNPCEPGPHPSGIQRGSGKPMLRPCLGQAITRPPSREQQQLRWARSVVMNVGASGLR